MTILENSIHIDAPPERVWSVLSTLTALEHYDPGIKRSELISTETEGIGAARRCDLTPGGWFNERVREWQPFESLAFELYECTLPLRRLTHRYELRPERGGTLVVQRMEYELKFGVVGRLMDVAVVKKKWDAGIKAFFVGLKRYVETDQRSSAHGAVANGL